MAPKRPVKQDPKKPKPRRTVYSVRRPNEQPPVASSSDEEDIVVIDPPIAQLMSPQQQQQPAPDSPTPGSSNEAVASRTRAQNPAASTSDASASSSAQAEPPNAPPIARVMSDSVVIIDQVEPPWRILPSLSSPDSSEDEFEVTFAAPNNGKRFRGVTWHTNQHLSPLAHVVSNSCTIDGFLTFLKLIQHYNELDPIVWHEGAFSSLLKQSEEESRQGFWAETVIRQVIDILRLSPIDADVPITPVIRAAEALAKYHWMRQFGNVHVTQQPVGANQGSDIDCLGVFEENVMQALRNCCFFVREWDCKCLVKRIKGYFSIKLSNSRDLGFFNRRRSDIFETTFEGPDPCNVCRSFLRPLYSNRNKGIFIPETTWLLKVDLSHGCRNPDKLTPVLQFRDARFYKIFANYTRHPRPGSQERIAHQAAVFYAGNRAFFYDSMVGEGLLQNSRPPRDFVAESVIYVKIPEYQRDPRPLLPSHFLRVQDPFNFSPPARDDGKGKGRGKKSAPGASGSGSGSGQAA